ncbi:hypothetical protein LH51_14335 [Nitrincola sp. A-D6]|uniref:hypothetical protein n=1 Tax=Nitrincola sp. A-D6 TaxID=1545442 RepID=UPI00051FA89B|nr:hypothetical protein [Nitrincola sp. A-D6]KGK41495.1 hypothetical protein LH51_14335 [Nitrincola sp. A-D6]
MTLTGILTVLWYSALPWLWLIALMLVMFLVPQIIARMKGYHFSATGGIGSKVLPPIIAIASLYFLPIHTQSTISYINTWVDWMNLIGASIGLGIYAWLVFHPICYLRNRKA